MTDLPEPLTPPDCDLRGMPYMPFDLVRLFDSDLYALSTGDEFKAAFTLWGKSFYQIPAGSLPADDRLLEHLSGARKWKAVRDMALRGWVKCSDGRLYHQTVAEKVLEAWASRLARRERTEAARAARHKSNGVSGGSDVPPVANSVTEKATEKATERVAENVTSSVTESKGTEQNRTEEERKKELATLVARDDDFETFWRAYPRKVGKGAVMRMWPSILKKTSVPVLLQAISAQRWDHRERFIPHPATWLNQERWLDETQGGDPVLRAVGLNDFGGLLEKPEKFPDWLQLPGGSA